jgi:WD40 repeat protein
MMSDTTQALEPPGTGVGKPVEYDAFLSYTHRDRAVASGIQKGLHQVGRRVGQLPSVAYSPDGQRVASSSLDHTIRLWPAQAVPKMLCDKLAANVSHTQWHDWVSPDVGYQTLCPGLPVAPD